VRERVSTDPAAAFAVHSGAPFMLGAQIARRPAS
jgi:hypothetical protein